MKRRDFLVFSSGAVVASIAATKMGFGQSPAPAAAPTGPVAETEAMATALKFHKDATKADAKIRTEATRLCSNCQLFKADPSHKGMGNCTIFQNRLVPEKGWCISWVKKA